MRIDEKDGNLIIVDFDEIEAYKIACKIERDGMEFYKRLLTRVKDAGIKDVLALLVSEENKHITFFEDALYKLKEEKEDLSEDDDILDNMDYGIFWPYQNMDEFENVLDQPKKALKLGIVIEDKSIRFYSSCKEKVSSSQAKGEISKIIDEEIKHKKLLESFML